MNTERPSIIDHLGVLADATRGRILLAVEAHELTVSELCSVLALPQSTVSRHLKTLQSAGWIHARPDGTRRLYSTSMTTLSVAAQRLWSLAGEQFRAVSSAREDALRLSEVLAVRRTRSRAFFAGAAGRWDRMRDELFGSRFHLLALLGLLHEDLVVADLGCGTGSLSDAIAPFVARVHAVDGSPEMLEKARMRLARWPNVEVLQGDLESLPLGDQSVGAATLALVLHHLPEPPRALAEVARVLGPGGRLLIVDMLRHDREEYREQMGHVWLGFEEQQVHPWLERAGLTAARFTPLAHDPSARGPALFALVAERSHTSRPPDGQPS